jgi:hypothetical protein
MSLRRLLDRLARQRLGLLESRGRELRQAVEHVHPRMLLLPRSRPTAQRPSTLELVYESRHGAVTAARALTVCRVPGCPNARPCPEHPARNGSTYALAQAAGTSARTRPLPLRPLLGASDRGRSHRPGDPRRARRAFQPALALPALPRAEARSGLASAPPLAEVVGEAHRHDREAVLLAEPTTHRQQPLVVGEEHVPALGNVRLDVEAIGGFWCSPPALRDRGPGLDETLHVVADDQVLADVCDLGDAGDLPRLLPDLLTLERRS